MRFQKYEKVAKSFEKFFDAEALSTILESKADADLLLRLKLEKANMNELE